MDGRVECVSGSRRCESTLAMLTERVANVSENVRDLQKTAKATEDVSRAWREEIHQMFNKFSREMQRVLDRLDEEAKLNTSQDVNCRSMMGRIDERMNSLEARMDKGLATRVSTVGFELAWRILLGVGVVVGIVWAVLRVIGEVMTFGY